VKSKIFKYGLWTFGTIFIVGLFYLFLEIREFEEESERLCDHGHGDTTLKLRVLDFNTNQRIDSVRLIIRYGMSAEKLVETLLKQEDNIIYNFSVPEVDDCESYWFELSSDLYWGEIYLKDTSKHLGIKKGIVNEMTLYLKPSTKVKVTVVNDLKEFNGDTLFLYIDRKDNKGSYSWNYFTEKNFEERKNAAEYFNLESDIDYRATWINKNNQLADTAYNDFHAKPFDTIKLYFTLKEKVK
jgi:hypothetical protein